MEIEEISIHVRPISGSRGCGFLPECDVIVEPGLVMEMLCCLDNQQLVLGEVFPVRRI